jgi:hypothetical protein
MEDLLEVFDNQTSRLILENNKSFKFYVGTAIVLFLFSVIVFYFNLISTKSDSNNTRLWDYLFATFFSSLLCFPIKEAYAKYNKAKSYEKIRRSLILVSIKSQGNENQVKELIWKAIEKLTLES